MKQEDLQKVQPGFDDPVAGCQAVFRQALNALSLPGRPVLLPLVAPVPLQGHGASALLLLALLDSDCTLWLSPSLANSEAQSWLRFHTGCRCVSDPAQARFLWLAAQDTWPMLGSINLGSDEYPDQSATCVMEVASFQTDEGRVWTFEGPGVNGQMQLAIEGLPQDFDAQWSDNHAAFPRGVDVFLASQTHVVGLPRSTRFVLCETEEA
jgi:alpha-D-ribose 1-methylphosphonate 5-triphosphate synthase subunit PhnH